MRKWNYDFDDAFDCWDLPVFAGLSDFHEVVFRSRRRVIDLTPPGVTPVNTTPPCCMLSDNRRFLLAPKPNFVIPQLDPPSHLQVRRPTSFVRATLSRRPD
jgi:hypothetical protein